MGLRRNQPIGLTLWRNEHVRPLLSTGWSPLFGTVVVSGASGRVLDAFVRHYEGYAKLAVVFGGVLLRLREIDRVRAEVLCVAQHKAQQCRYSLTLYKA